LQLAWRSGDLVIGPPASPAHCKRAPAQFERSPIRQEKRRMACEVQMGLLLRREAPYPSVGSGQGSLNIPRPEEGEISTCYAAHPSFCSMAIALRR
jgi:hypothetical protein